MCLTTEALLIFLSLLAPEIVEVSSDEIVINAELNRTRWSLRDESWCTRAPQIDAMIRLKSGLEA